MTRIGKAVTVTVGLVVLLNVAPACAQAPKLAEQTQPAKQVKRAQPAKQVQQKKTVKPVEQKQAAKPAEQDQAAKGSPAAPAVEKKPHHLVLQVNVNDPATMNLALNNASNVAQYYQARGEQVEIDVVAFGPGLHMLREDTSPVKARIKALAESTPSISFEACGNTRENMSRSESKDVPLISEAKLVESGVVRIMQRQQQGWTYVRP